jgi:hypothetical protein
MRTALVLLGFVLINGCQKDTVAKPPPATVQQPETAKPRTEDECVSEWLKAHHLDEYGNAEGTMYAGGTPLFDEASGTTKDRLTYVYEKQPEAKTACRADKK